MGENAPRSRSNDLDRQRQTPFLVIVSAAVLLGLVLVEPVLALFRLHPYQMTYFNVFVGGLTGAEGRFETDYWLTSYKEGMEWIQAASHPSSGRTATHGAASAADVGALQGRSPVPRSDSANDSGADFRTRETRPSSTETASRTEALQVLVAANPLSKMCAEYYARPGTAVETTFEFSESREIPPPFDYSLSTTRYGLDRNFPDSPIVHRIGRDGATFAVIRRRTTPTMGPDAADTSPAGR